MKRKAYPGHMICKMCGGRAGHHDYRCRMDEMDRRILGNQIPARYDIGHSDPRPDPRTHPEYWTE